MRTCSLIIAAGAVLLLHASASAQAAPPAPTAAGRMSQPGPQERELRERLGTWDVVATLWPSSDAPPIVTRGLVAERVMVGPILQETMRPGPGGGTPDFRRLDFLNFDRVEGRWKYVSMDTRFPVSIMPAASFGPDGAGEVRVQFEPQGFVGFGAAVEGRFMVSDMTITHLDADHEIKRQRASLATGDGKPWLFVQYEYTRRRP